MTEGQREATNAAKLCELHPGIRAKVAAVLRDLEGHGYRPRIVCAARSEQDQAAAVASGYSTVRWSFHLARNKTSGLPEALAADIIDDGLLWTEGPQNRRFWLMLASSAWAHGLGTGTLWGLTRAQRKAVKSAIADRHFTRAVRLGWDPGHVEVRGLPLALAKIGVRPRTSEGKSIYTGAAQGV